MDVYEIANVNDIPVLASICFQAFNESDVTSLGCPPDMVSVLEVLGNLVVKEHVMVLKVDGVIAGIAAYDVDTAWWSSARVLKSLIVFIKPEHRTFTRASNVLKILKQCAILNEVPLITDILSSKDADRKAKFFQYLGFEPCGSLFVFKP